MDGAERQEPQCKFYVVRKKRLCRMTVRPGRDYCGEHEPEPEKYSDREGLWGFARVPCPYDSKHTCYASKLQGHLLICNARPQPPAPYVVADINAPPAEVTCPRVPLIQVPKETLMQIIGKINYLYQKYVEHNIDDVDEDPLHPGVREEWSVGGAKARRHLRQASALLRLAEREGLVADDTCYVELGAGRGQLSQYGGVSWGGNATGSVCVLVDRSSPRHKRDMRAAGAGARTVRVRADLRHVALRHLPVAVAARHLVGLAKHLCGVATDYALRCMTEDGVVAKTRGLVVATCCHHRCESHNYVGATHLKKLDVNEEDLNVMLGVVSWATCGDGRSRTTRQPPTQRENEDIDRTAIVETKSQQENDPSNELSWSRHQNALLSKDWTETDNSEHNKDTNSNGEYVGIETGLWDRNEKSMSMEGMSNLNTDVLTRAGREEVGRRAKAVLDWGRALYLRDKGFRARLVHFVPTSVSLENFCIVASKDINDT